MTSKDLPSATSSPESGSGHTPCGAPDGPMTDLFGQALAPANPSARPAKAKALKMTATFGPTSTALSPSETLTWLLVSKLQAKSALNGSILYALTWKNRATPSGRLIPALRASAHRISGNGCIGPLKGWNTPVCVPNTEACHGQASGNLKTEVRLAAWNTPRATDGSKGGPNQAGGALPADAAMAAWPTPTMTDYKGGYGGGGA